MSCKGREEAWLRIAAFEVDVSVWRMDEVGGRFFADLDVCQMRGRGVVQR